MQSDSFVQATAAQWKSLVEHARYFRENDRELARRLAADSKTSPAALKAKIKAIRWAWESGLTFEDVIGMGQNATMRAHRKAKRASFEPSRELKWRVSRSLADAVMSDDPSPDAEEALVTRLKRVCKIRYSDDLFEFLLSIFADLSDKELQNLAGAYESKRQKKTSRTEV